MACRTIILFFILLLGISQTAFALNILCLGDSLTEGYGVGKAEAWPALVEANLKAKRLDITLNNAGISGSTSASAQSRLTWHFKSKVKFDWMILALGANDGLRGQSTKNIKNNLANAIDTARKAGVKKVILTGIQVPPNYGSKYASEFSKIFPDLAKEMNVPLIPFLLDGVAGKPELNLPDGIHPNAKGHKIIAEKITKFIESQL